MTLMRYAFVIFIVYLSSQVLFIRAETYGECDEEEPGTYVIKLDNCAEYIFCNGTESELYECEEGEYFDLQNEFCDDKENVYCSLDENANEDPDEGEEPVEEEYIDTTDITTTTTILETVTTANTQVDILEQSPVVKDTCPSTDDPKQIILVASNNSCSDYYVCYHGHALEMHCMDHLHFNSLTGKCDFPENSNCKISNQPLSSIYQCLPHVTNFFPHPQNCNYFIYCIKGYVTIQQCPFYYGWDIESRSCVHMKHAKCYTNTHI